jgi:hypothetical protein
MPVPWRRIHCRTLRKVRYPPDTLGIDSLRVHT